MTLKMFTVFLLLLPSAALCAQDITISGQVVDSKGDALHSAVVQLIDHGHIIQQASTNRYGQFSLNAKAPGQYLFEADVPGFRPVQRTIYIGPAGLTNLDIRMTDLAIWSGNVTVTANSTDSDVLSPDPAERVFVRQDLLDANPGRPGAPVSIPGYPIETASGGIKAPQYFAPGVAGDHGEPVAQFIAVGSYLLPNNLSANAHGNGYADPNILIPAVLQSVQIDGGAFNVREGNHSVNFATTYGLRSLLDPFVTVTADYRDIDVVTAIRPSLESWIALEASYGNGLLDRLEHRQQYKLNAQRIFHAGQHQITMFGIGYYGQSYVPGLVPIFPFNYEDANFPNYGDTIDPRQKDQTHTALIAVNDVWQASPTQQWHFSDFFRTYNLSLYSDFGQGLIRQSEFRTVTGSNVSYINQVSQSLSLLAGLDYEREAPRRDNLDHYGFFNRADPSYYGPFTPVDSNNVTIEPITPFAAIQGTLANQFRYYLGWQRNQIYINNQDLLHPDNSFSKWVGLNAPKATLSFLPSRKWLAPVISLSYGEAYFTEDPRIGTGTSPGDPVSTAHSYQLVASRSVHNTDVRLTLGHVTTSATLAKLDPDTGLQINQGPGRLRFLTATVNHNFRRGSLLATFSKADARDLSTGDPTPEAPRTIFDLLGSAQLPWHLQARSEFEYVGIKPLGTGCLPVLNNECTGTSVREFRGAILRPFKDGRIDVAANFLVASGYTGQTTENFFPSNIQEVAGVRTPSYISVSITYNFGHDVVTSASTSDAK
jgi:Carboxypeptidase regulatory-like domain